MITCLFENENKASLRHVVVDALVLTGDEILLVKRSEKLLEGGKWALVGGYVNRDETLTQAVEREVHEETGWTVTNIQQLRVIDNPHRPGEDRQNIAFVFTCDAVEKEGESDWESSDVQWFKLDKLPPQDQFAFDHYSNVEYYLKKQK